MTAPRCSECGEVHDLFVCEMQPADVRCEACWRSTFDFGRRHVGEAWENAGGEALPDPLLVPVGLAEARCGACGFRTDDVGRAGSSCPSCGGRGILEFRVVAPERGTRKAREAAERAFEAKRMTALEAYGWALVEEAKEYGSKAAEDSAVAAVHAAEALGWDVLHDEEWMSWCLKATGVEILVESMQRILRFRADGTFYPDPEDGGDLTACRELLRPWVGRLGLGFHPDTRGRDYVSPDGTPALTAEEAAAYDAAIYKAHAVGDPYAAGLAIWREMEGGAR